MKNKILLNNVSTLEKNSKGTFVNSLNNINLEFNNNEINAFITDSFETKMSISNLFLKKINPIYGEIIFEGDYFNKNYKYLDNKISFISDSIVDKYASSNISVSSFLTKNLDNKILNYRIFGKRLFYLKMQIRKLEKENKSLLKEKYSRELIFNNELEKIIDWSKKDNNIFDENIERDYQEYLQFKKQIKDINKFILTSKKDVFKRIENLEKFHLGKEINLKQNFTKKIKLINDWKNSEIQEFKDGKNKISPTDEQIKKINERIKRACIDIVNFVRKLDIFDFELNIDNKILLEKIESADDIFIYLENIDNLISLLERIKKFSNSEISIEIDKKINYVNNAKDFKSAINSSVFNDAYNSIIFDWEEKIFYFKKVIKDIEKKESDFFKKIKNETSLLKRRVFEFEIISLRFQRQIYKEKIFISENNLKKINLEAFNHTKNNISNFYNVLQNCESIIHKADLHFNIWRLMRQKKCVKFENKIYIKKYLKDKKNIKFKIKGLNNILKKIEYRQLYVQKFIDDLYEKIINSKEYPHELHYLVVDKIEKNKEKISAFKSELEFVKKRIDFGDENEKNLLLSYILDNVSFSTDFLDKSLNEFSKSQIQRLLIIRSMLEEYKFIIIDKPINDVYMDAKTSLTNTIQKVCQDYDVNFFVFTKDIKLASKFSDKLFIISRGRVVEYGKPKEILNNPIHPFTKEIVKNIEKINFFEDYYNFENFAKKTLHQNIFTKINLYNISNTHKVLTTYDEFKEWTK